MLGLWVWHPRKRENPSNEGLNVKVFNFMLPLIRINLEQVTTRVTCNLLLLCFTLKKVCKQEKHRKTQRPPFWRCVAVLLVLDPSQILWHSCFANLLLKRKGKGQNERCTLEVGLQRICIFSGRKKDTQNAALLRTRPLHDAHTPIGSCA